MQCPSCHGIIESNNYTLTILTAFLIWSIVLTPVLFLLFSGTLTALVLEFAVGIPLFFWLTPKFIEFHVRGEAT